MIPRPPYALPPEIQQQLRRAVILEWATILSMLTVIVVVYFTMGNSQAMKTAWAEDLLSLVPPLAYLIALRMSRRAPDKDFPYGRYRTTTISFLVASVALAAFGGFLVYEAVMTLVRREHPSIGTMEVFGRPVWLGWLMIGAMVYSAIPPVIIGRIKLRVSEQLHENTLHTDANMNKADWMTALAAILGVIGIGYGYWWADAVAAGFISIDVLRDGIKNTRHSVDVLLEHSPTKVGQTKDPDPLNERILQTLRQLPYVRDADIRLREEGQVLSGEAFVVFIDDTDPTQRVKEAVERILELDWRIYDIVVMPVEKIDR